MRIICSAIYKLIINKLDTVKFPLILHVWKSYVNNLRPMNAREKGRGMYDFRIILTIFAQFVLFEFVAIKNSYQNAYVNWDMHTRGLIFLVKQISKINSNGML